MSTGDHTSLGIVAIVPAWLAGLSVPRPKAIEPESAIATLQEKSPDDGYGLRRVSEFEIDESLRAHRVFVGASAEKRHRIGLGGLFTPIDHDRDCLVIVAHGSYITTLAHCELKR